MAIKIGIYCFSGTGNTEIIAKMVRQSLHDRGKIATVLPMEETLRGKKADPRDFDLIGIAYPVHAFNAPRIVYDFIKNRMTDGGKPVFLLSTCGGPCVCNDYASAMVRRVLLRKGYSVVNEGMFFLSANLLFSFPDSLIKQLYLASLRRADAFAAKLVSRESVPKKRRPLPELVNWLGHFEGRYRSYARACLRIDGSRCIGCGKCASRCPTGNIMLTGEDRHPVFGRDCITCLRCVYLCPDGAIQPKRLKWAIIPERYDIRETIERVLTDENVPVFVTGETKGYYRAYYDYIYGK